MSNSAVFDQMAASLKQIQDRLAPANPTMVICTVNKHQHTAGIVIESFPLNGPFNTIVSNLSAGIVNVFFGSGSGGQAQLVLSPSDNPIIVPLGKRTDKVVTFKVADNSPPAQGSIILEFY